jgi:hypothetical protein
MKEARWWVAVLAQGRGWHAVMTAGPETFWSPWSIRVHSGPKFIISRQPNASDSSPSTTPPSPREALGFLDKFCVRHNIIDQSHAALAAVLLLPSIPDTIRVLSLPAVVINKQLLAPTKHIRGPPRSSLRHDWLRQPNNHLDKLLTLGCNIHGTESMLLNAFYNPEIECNAVSPWLGGALAIIDSLAVDKPLVLGRMMMDRRPEVAFLWVGATVLNLQKELLETIRIGFFPNDLNAAAWSGTLQHFLQQPTRGPLAVDGQITRADQCRLLSMHLANSFLLPNFPWKPFGSTPLDLVDPGVRRHAACKGHRLQYRDYFWSKDEMYNPTRAPGIRASHTLSTNALGQPKQGPASDLEALLSDQFASRMATFDIFDFMFIVSPFSLEDREIWQHDWLKRRFDDKVDESQGEDRENGANDQSEASRQKRRRPKQASGSPQPASSSGSSSDDEANCQKRKKSGRPGLSSPSSRSSP